MPFYIFMLFYIYILYSTSLDRYYVGYSSDLDKRIVEHNTGMSTYTSKATDWEIKYSESFATREEAHARELAIKRKKSRKYIEWLVSSIG